jgi:hypothetical protein
MTIVDVARSVLLDGLREKLPPGYAIVPTHPSDDVLDAGSLAWLNGNAGPGRSNGNRYRKSLRRAWDAMIAKAAEREAVKV